MSTKKQKAEKAAKPAKSENKAKNSPKWGTEAWIDAYPWAKMDKDRRRRVRKALGYEGNPATVQIIDVMDSGLRNVRDLFSTWKLSIPENEISKAKDAMEALREFFMRATNTVVAYELSVKWGLDGAPVVKPCDGKCKKPCKKACKGGMKA